MNFLQIKNLHFTSPKSIKYLATKKNSKNLKESFYRQAYSLLITQQNQIKKFEKYQKILNAGN